MPPAKTLSRADEMLMISIVVLGEDAYSTTIRSELQTRASKKVTVGSLWVSLDNLTERGYVRKRSAPNPGRRGGRPRVYYRITPRGIRALQRARTFHERLWKDVPDLEDYG